MKLIQLRKWIPLLPKVGRMGWRLVKDPRTPPLARAGLVALVGYLVTPIDIIPDWIPLAGRLDDAVIAIFGLRFVLGYVPDDLLVEYWDGKPDELDWVIGRDVPRAEVEIGRLPGSRDDALNTGPRNRRP